MKLSIIVPVYNEQAIIKEQLSALKKQCSADVELIIVDGGSQDGSLSCAKAIADKVISSDLGRAQQMNAGANVAQAPLLLFLHIDTCLPNGFIQQLQQIDENSLNWGRFDVRFSSRRFIFSIIANMMNLRSRLTGVCTGDQAIFMTRQLFHKVNGFPNIDLMEDVAISKSLRKLQRPICLKEKVITSSRRWEEKGIVKTT